MLGLGAVDPEEPEAEVGEPSDVGGGGGVGAGGGGVAVFETVIVIVEEVVSTPPASRARADQVWVPFGTYLLYHVTVYGAMVSSGPKFIPLRMN